MDKYSFLQFVKDHIKEFLGEKYSNCEVRINETIKNNGLVLNGMSLHDPEFSGVSPCIYLDNYYDEYMDGANIKDIMLSIANIYEKHDVVKIQSPEELIKILSNRDNIYPDLVLTRRNREKLENIPHREVMNLSVTYRAHVDIGTDGVGSVLINNSVMEQYGYTEEELFKVAYDNLQTNYKAEIKSMVEILMGELPIEMREEMRESLEGPMPMYVISDEKRMNGSGYLLDPKTLSKVSDIFQDDVCVIPSSVHELIAVPLHTGGMSVDDISEMVNTVNDSQVAPEEQLSDTCYVFLAQSQQIMEADEYKKSLREAEMDQQEVLEQKRAAHM